VTDYREEALRAEKDAVEQADRADAAEAEVKRWLDWSGGQHPDDSPGDVIAAYPDGTIVLDDDITTWNPLRACAWLATNHRPDSGESAAGEAAYQREARKAIRLAVRRAEAAEARLEAQELELALLWELRDNSVALIRELRARVPPEGPAEDWAKGRPGALDRED